MATKVEYEGKPAYREGFFILAKTDDNLWIAIHEKSDRPAMHYLEPMKQKRDVMNYVNDLMATNVDWNFSTLEQFLDMDHSEIYEVIERHSNNG